jgi:hypothetical protein
MHDPQAAVEQTLTLRRDALTAIAANVTQAAASRETATALTTIEKAMGSLYASDILWTQIGKPGIQKVLKDEGVDGQPLPPGNFMPADAATYLDQTTLSTKIGAITGTSSSSSSTSGIHGLSLDSTTIGSTRLSPDTTTTVPSDSTEIDIGVTNAGDSDETGISVTVQIGASSLTGQLQSLTAGQSGTIKIPLTTKPTPGTTTLVEVAVTPVANEQATDNNSAKYNVIFGS